MTRGLTIDSFAGGGGASLGIAWATGRAPDVAINHDASALAMHAANHPETLHVCEDVWHANLRDLTQGRPVELLWASPDCSHFSRAKGSVPVSKQIRSLAWVVVRWASQVRPRMIILENVREFADWGPLVPRWECRCGWKGTEGQATLKRSRRRCPRCESLRIKPTLDLMPDPFRKGMTFRLFANRLRGMGYQVEWRNINAADYGAPTNRRRLFLIARNDGCPIEWPEPSHGDPTKIGTIGPDLFHCRCRENSHELHVVCPTCGLPRLPRLAPWKTAASCIDWSIECPSIFDRKRPLAEKTLRRIAMGLKRYVLEAAEPFVVGVGGRAGQTPPTGASCPLGTVTAKNDRAVVAPYVAPITHNGERRCHDVNEPLPTVTTAHRGEQAVIAPYLTAYHHQKQNESRCRPCDDAFNTIDTQPRYGLVSPTLIQTGFGERDGQAPRVLDLNQPLGTVVAGGQKHALVSAFLSKHYGGHETPGSRIDAPIDTITAKDHNALTTAHLVKFRGDSNGTPLTDPMPTVTSGQGSARPAGAPHALGIAATCLARFNHGHKQWNGVDEPLGTVTSQGNKFGLVYAFLTKYFGADHTIGQQLTEPLHTVTSKHRFGMVYVEVAPGQAEPAVAMDVPGVGPCVISDIGMRMLTPRELARAQGFPDTYKLTGTKTSQVAKIGNSVCPQVVEAIVKANVGAEVCA